MNSYLYYQISSIKLATSIEEIKEVARTKNLITKDKLPRNIVGFFELRGKRICIFDLPAFLDIKPDSDFEIILITTNEHYVGFKVGKISGIISTDDIKPYPEIVGKKEYLKGVILHNKEILQVLSLAKILSGPRLKAIQKYL